MARKSDLLQGTLDMLVLRVLTRGELHGWGITLKLEQLSKSALQVDEGSLYPALYRMEDKGWIKAEWKMTENNRRAKFYALTPSGRNHLEAEQESWQRVTGIIALRDGCDLTRWEQHPSSASSNELFPPSRQPLAAPVSAARRRG